MLSSVTDSTNVDRVAFGRLVFAHPIDRRRSLTAKELFIGTHGSEDPTKATLPFLMVGGAIDAGHEPAIILVGDAVVLIS